MVPTMDLATQITDLQGRGLSILGTHNFKDLRGGQEGSGDKQTFVLWGTSNMNMGNVLTQLAEISQGLQCIANPPLPFIFIDLMNN